MLKQTKLLAFDDVWLEPRYSEINSRKDPDLSSRLSQSCLLKHPVIASNMASVVGPKMVQTFDQSGSIAIHHRFLPKNQLVYLAQEFSGNYFAFSVGIKDDDLDIAKEIYQIIGNKAVILVDIAHAHTKNMGIFLDKINKIGYETLIAGNVATAEGFRYLSDHGATAVRVGIAGGRVCTTKYITGHHIPTLQSVIECADEKNNVYLIADGGISSSGDAAKLLAAGADFVCVGSVFAATSDAPGNLVHNTDGTSYKLHYGMSSQTAIHKFYGESKRHVVPEGKSERLPYSGETIEVLNAFIAGIKSAFSYSGAIDLPDFQKKAILRFKSV